MRSALHVQKFSHGTILSLQHKYGDGKRGDIARYKSSSTHEPAGRHELYRAGQEAPTQTDAYLIKGVNCSVPDFH